MLEVFVDFRTGDFWVRNLAGFRPCTVLVHNTVGTIDQITFLRNSIHCQAYRGARNV